MQVAVIGLGYVGLVSAACFARLGHRVVGFDINSERVESLRASKIPISEPGLLSLVREGVDAGRLSFETRLDKALFSANVVLICVGTPTLSNGDVDESQVLGFLETLSRVRENIGEGAMLVLNRSTCPVDLHLKVENHLKKISSDKRSFGYCVHPEFLREARAIEDFFAPAKIVFGLGDMRHRAICEGLYRGQIDAPMFFVDVGVASFVKYADNCFHALKVTFANEIGILAKEYDVDARTVMKIFCSDTKLNISSTYLRPGMPFGGSCLPKDLSGLNAMAAARKINLPLMSNIGVSNDYQISNIIEKICSLTSDSGAKLGFYGITFKSSTSDTRSSPVLKIIQALLVRGFDVCAYDPILSVEVGLIDPSMDPRVRAVLLGSCRDVFSNVEIAVITQPIRPDDAADGLVTAKFVLDLAGVLPAESQNTYGLYW